MIRRQAMARTRIAHLSPINQLPWSRVNPVSLDALQMLNAAAAKYGQTTTKPLNNPANNYTTNLPFTKTTDSFDIKADYTITDEDHIQRSLYSWQRVGHISGGGSGSFLGRPAGGRPSREREIEAPTAPESTTITPFLLNFLRKPELA